MKEMLLRNIVLILTVLIMIALTILCTTNAHGASLITETGGSVNPPIMSITINPAHSGVLSKEWGTYGCSNANRSCFSGDF